MKCFAFLLAFLTLVSLECVCVCAQEGPPRHWTTSDGVRSTVKLALVEYSGTSVKLRREDNGKLVTMHLTRLSQEDRAYLRQLKEAPAAEETPAVGGADWPQWRGQARDGKSVETGLLAEWPSGGPELLWTASGLGQGYSTPTVRGAQLYVLGTAGGREAVFCLDTRSGQQVWSSPLGSIAEGGGYKGPRGSATLDEGNLFALGSDGTLCCKRVNGGDDIWRANLKSDFGGAHGPWAYAESPLVDGKQLVVTPGGSQATMVALDKTRGSVIWRGSAGELGDEYTVANYASPIVATLAGTRQYLAFLGGGVVGFDAASGTALWHYDAPANRTANCSTPVTQGDTVFAASGYGTGGGQARISRQGRQWSVSESYFVNKFQNHHGGFVLVDGHIYGTNDSSLMCLDWNTGNVRWQDRSVGKGSVCYADGHLYVRGEGGAVALVEATPQGYREKGRFDQMERSNKPAWPHPVVASGKLYIHDQDKLFCYQVR